MNWQLPDTMTGTCAVVIKAAVANVAGANVVATVVVVVVKTWFVAAVALVVATVDILIASFVLDGVINVAKKSKRGQEIKKKIEKNWQPMYFPQ